MEIPMEKIKNEQQKRYISDSDIQKCMDTAIYGVVYVALGNNLSRQILIELIETFRSMKQIFLFQHIPIEYNDLPSNVIIYENLLSKVILSHKNTTLFITRDENLSIRRALHHGIPMLIIPFQNSEIHRIVKSTALENICTVSFEEISRKILGQKLRTLLNNKNLKIHAKEIANLLHHNSVDLVMEPIRRNTQTSRQLSTSHLHLDALGALFFVIFVIVKLSLKFCRFYNNWEWKSNATSKKMK